MKDRVVQHPNRYRLTPVPGSSDTYDFTAVPGTVTEAGTPINKASLLTDNTSALLGLTNATVNAALGKLSAGVLRRGNSLVDTLGNLVQIPGSQVVDGIQISTGSYTGTGTYGESNPCILTFDFLPKLLLIYGAANYNYSIGTHWVGTIVSPIQQTNSNTKNQNTTTWGSTISWYSSSQSGFVAQANVSGFVYNYLALG